MHNIDNRVKWQIECDDTIKEKDNVILSSPTGSGKTKRYEIWALGKPERPIFITSPIKALSNQRFRQLLAEGYKVGLETGDIKYSPYEDCDIICCTQEIYNNKYINYADSTLVIDEFSYVFEDEERARVYIDSLHNSKAKNIIICSATFGNPKEIREYINKVTNRDFFLYENSDRLTELEYKGEIAKGDIRDSLVVTYSKRNCEIIAREIYNDRIARIRQVISNRSFSNIDPRTRYKKEILQLAQKYGINNTELIELSTIGVTYYYGGLYPKEKLFVEELFENRLIDTVVGTDALALGVNFPIKNVVFTQLKKNQNDSPKKISKNLFDQLSGRAGRKGFFDKGYVYYCGDFSIDKANNPKGELRESFSQLVSSANERVSISLTANIRDILVGKTTIDEEANFVTEYSTATKNKLEEYENISKTIEFVRSFDVAKYYLKQKFPNLNFSKGYDEALVNCTEKTKRKIGGLSASLTMLQPHFDKDIGEVYLPEYLPEQNCAIFADILTDSSLDDLVKKYGKSLRDLLLLRKFIDRLPSQYCKNYDISQIDNIVNSMDYTIFHPDEFNIGTTFNNEKSKTKVKEKQVQPYSCPTYFDIISIADKTYVKILVQDRVMLVCDCSNDENLTLSKIPLNTKYSLVGFIKPDNRLDILDRIDTESLDDENEQTTDKIEGMKLFLKRKHKSSKPKSSK